AANAGSPLQRRRLERRGARDRPRSEPSSPEADARIEPRIEQIDREIREHEDRDCEHDKGLRQRIVLGVTRLPQFQSLAWTVSLWPSSRTSSSRAEGGRPRNSIAARSARIASTRTACLAAKMPTNPSR